MIIPDVNVLLNAYNPDSHVHVHCKEWWEETLSGTEMVGLSWITILGFLRISTRPRLAMVAWTPAEAMKHVRDWLKQPCVIIVHPEDTHMEILFELIKKAGVAGNLTSDAHLAALTIEHRAVLVSTDSDFARFAGLRWMNPAAPKK